MMNNPETSATFDPSQVIDPDTGQPLSAGVDGEAGGAGAGDAPPMASQQQAGPISQSGFSSYIQKLFSVADQIRNTPATVALRNAQQMMLSDEYARQRHQQQQAYQADAKLKGDPITGEGGIGPRIWQQAVGNAPLTKEQELPGLQQKQQSYAVVEQQIKNETRIRKENAKVLTRQAEDYFLSPQWDDKVEQLQNQYGEEIGDKLNKISDLMLQRASTGNLGNPVQELNTAIRGLVDAYDKKKLSTTQKWDPETASFKTIVTQKDPVDKYMEKLNKIISIKNRRDEEDFGERSTKLAEVADPVNNRIAALDQVKTEDERLNEEAKKSADGSMKRDDAVMQAGLKDLEGQSKEELKIADKIISNDSFGALASSIADDGQQQPDGSTQMQETQQGDASSSVPHGLANIIDPDTGKTFGETAGGTPAGQPPSPAPQPNPQPPMPSAEMGNPSAPVKAVMPPSSKAPKEGLLGNENSIPAFAQSAWNESKDIGRAIGEFGYEAGNKLGMVSDNRLNEVYQTVASQRKADADLLKSKYGQDNNFAIGAGEIATDILATLAPGNAAVKAVSAIPKIGNAVGILGTAIKGAAGGAGSGAAMGFLTPTEGDSSRLDNIESGATYGGIGGGLLGATIGGVAKIANALRPSLRAAGKAETVTGPITDDVQKMRDVAAKTGTFAEPSVQSGSAVAKSTEAEAALSKKGLVEIEGKLVNREKVLRDNIKSAVEGISDPADAAKASQLYKKVLGKQVPPEVQKEILSNPVIAKAYKEMHKPGNYDLENIQPGTFAEFDKLKRVIDGRVYKGVNEAGGKTTELEKDLRRALDGSEDGSRKGMRELLDGVDDTYAQARKFSERAIIKKQMLSMMDESKIKSSSGETDLFNMYHNMFDTTAKRNYFFDRLQKAGADTSQLNDLLDFVGNVEKSGLYRLVGRQSLNIGRLESSGGASAAGFAATRNYIKSSYNKAFVELITSPRWEQQVARINSAKTDQAKVRLLTQTLARIAGIEGGKPTKE